VYGQEVFLRLAAQNRGVNYTETDFSRQEVVKPPPPPQQQQHQHASAARLCVLCGTAPPELVTLFTCKGIAVQSADVICAACSVKDPVPVTAIADAAHAAAVDNAAEPAVATPGPHFGVSAELNGVSVSVAASGVGGGVGATAVGVANGAAVPRGDRGASLEYKAGPTSSSELPHHVPMRAMVEPAVSPGGGKPLLAASYDSPTSAASSAGRGMEAVSLARQVSAVLLLRLQLQGKQKKSNCCNGACSSLHAARLHLA
jgi:hypothetical protein